MKASTKLMKNLKKINPRGFNSAVLAGCFLVSMALLLLSASYIVPFPSLSSWFSSTEAPSGYVVEDNTAHPASQKQKLERKPLCDTSDRLSDICDMEGDIRVQGTSSSILYVSSSYSNTTEQESWQIKPHPKKGDIAGMYKVTEVSIRTLNSNQDAPKCGIRNKVPAIIFSTGGYMGNFFHDFNDVMISLYLTSQEFHGEVQFLIREMLPWWNVKYERILKQLTHYEIIDFNDDSIVRCYTRVIVGIKSHGRNILGIDPAISNGLTILDFGQFIKSSYGLQRKVAIKLGESIDTKPRLMILGRSSTRKFLNMNEIVGTSQALGFEVVVAEMQANSSLAEFAEMVNSFDVILGVHGAGLTNLLFLPINAVVIQVCPIGGLDGVCWSHFGRITMELSMRYLQYSISYMESTLIEEYPLTDPNNPVLTNPRSIMNQKDGWRIWQQTYFVKQNVKLDMDRFNTVLLQALEHLRH